MGKYKEQREELKKNYELACKQRKEELEKCDAEIRNRLAELDKYLKKFDEWSKTLNWREGKKYEKKYLELKKLKRQMTFYDGNLKKLKKAFVKMSKICRRLKKRQIKIDGIDIGLKLYFAVGDYYYAIMRPHNLKMGTEKRIKNYLKEDNKLAKKVAKENDIENRNRKKREDRDAKLKDQEQKSATRAESRQSLKERFHNFILRLFGKQISTYGSSYIPKDSSTRPSATSPVAEKASSTEKKRNYDKETELLRKIRRLIELSASLEAKIYRSMTTTQEYPEEYLEYAGLYREILFELRKDETLENVQREFDRLTSPEKLIESVKLIFEKRIIDEIISFIIVDGDDNSYMFNKNGVDDLATRLIKLTAIFNPSEIAKIATYKALNDCTLSERGVICMPKTEVRVINAFVKVIQSNPRHLSKNERTIIGQNVAYDKIDFGLVLLKYFPNNTDGLQLSDIIDRINKTKMHKDLKQKFRDRVQEIMLIQEENKPSF